MLLKNIRFISKKGKERRTKKKSFILLFNSDDRFSIAFYSIFIWGLLWGNVMRLVIIFSTLLLTVAWSSNQYIVDTTGIE